MYLSGSPPGNGGGSGGGNSSGSRAKRLKRGSWGARERAGMSFLIVVAFFAVFGLIILTEVLMIDDRGRGGSVVVRHASMSGGGGGGRLGESMPDYDDVKVDYSLEDAGIFVRANKFDAGGLSKILKNNYNSARDAQHLRMAIGVPIRSSDTAEGRNGIAAIPWGQVLPAKVEQTLPAYPARARPTDGVWQVVNGTRFKFFVFSAFYDRRDGKMVRVVGATKTRSPERVWCRFWYPTTGGPATNATKYVSASVMARVKVIRENWNLKYSACFILCPLRMPGLEPPHAVSVVSRIRTPPGNVLTLRNTDWDVDFANRSIGEVPATLGVCVKPLHFNYDNALHLLEFIELNTLLGVTHFTLYNHTIGPRASCILRHYIAGTTTPAAATAAANSSTWPRSTVTLLPWNLKMRSQKEIRTEGLFAALNDCLYRRMYRDSFTALIDLDEFIIPRHNDTLNELLKWLSLRINNRNIGAYSFQNAFFYLQFSDDTLMYETASGNNQLRGALTTQRKTRRRSKLHPQKQRSKYICKPEAVIEAGNHFVWEFVPGRGSLNVPADAAILHHYRVCEFGGDDCIKTPSLVDRTAHKYATALLARVATIYDHLKVPCNLPNLPPAPTRPPPPPPPPPPPLKNLPRPQAAKSRPTTASRI